MSDSRIEKNRNQIDMEEKKTYEASVRELERLVERIEDPDRTFAETMEDIRRGRMLVEQCREMLRTTESEIIKQEQSV